MRAEPGGGGRPGGVGGVGAGGAGGVDDLVCGRCGHGYRARVLDRHLWCEDCVAAGRREAGRVGWICGAVMAAGLAAWIYFVQQPSAMLLGGWIGAVLATFWLGGRAGRELAYGVLRFRHRPR